MGFYSHPTAGPAQYLDFEEFSGFCPDISTKCFAEEMSYGTCLAELGLHYISRCLARLALSIRGSSGFGCKFASQLPRSMFFCSGVCSSDFFYVD
jgi:hypothetical protein